ncbi:flagellar motor protein MotB [Nocardioides sp. YIM 152315]|uniref:OmpA/MotB family protein n=1 Tax=Nocardioides sp. YIM 152315 TaxID=3031760 RepID=UPI0023DB0E31|nr:flagellar motor protein MotB [Nocardioides sp. YIM 152315]MDF1605973.1 flagellar motor protein MotB [Nocardioides sp. YIM 152315]
MAANRGRRTKHEEPEEHENHERWMVTYADMLTLLMVLFIVMFAMSQVDEKKYNALKNGLSDGFGATSSFMKGSDSILEGHLTDDATNPQMDATQMFEQLSPGHQALVTRAVEQQQRQRAYAAATSEARRLRDAQRKIMAALRKRGLAQDVSTTIDDRGLVVSLVSRHVTFQPNIATLSPRGRRVVDTIAPVLRNLDNDLRVDGHTNQAPGRPKYYTTDWDLSAARAVEVLRRLNEVAGIAGARLSLEAFGHERPLLDPEAPGSQAVNKRVDIVVLPAVGASSKELLDEAADSVGRGPGTDPGTDPGTSTETTTETTTQTTTETHTTDGDHGDEAASADHGPEGDH